MAGVKLNIGKKTISVDYQKIGENKLLLQRIFDAIKHMFSTKDHKKGDACRGELVCSP